MHTMHPCGVCVPQVSHACTMHVAAGRPRGTCLAHVHREDVEHARGGHSDRATERSHAADLAQPAKRHIGLPLAPRHEEQVGQVCAPEGGRRVLTVLGLQRVC